MRYFVKIWIKKSNRIQLLCSLYLQGGSTKRPGVWKNAVPWVSIILKNFLFQSWYVQLGTLIYPASIGPFFLPKWQTFCRKLACNFSTFFNVLRRELFSKKPWRIWKVWPISSKESFKSMWAYLVIHVILQSSMTYILRVL